MATETLERTVAEIERRVGAIEGRFPKNSSRHTQEGHDHRIENMIGGSGVFLKLAGEVGGQIARGDTAAAGTLTLYGGSVPLSPASRIILGDDVRFGAAAVVFRNASDQIIMQQVAGVPDVLFPGQIHADGGIRIGTFGGSQVGLARTGSGYDALTVNEALQARATGAGANVNDPILRDRAGNVRVQLNSLPSAGSAHVQVVGIFNATGGKLNNLLIYDSKTDALVVKATLRDLVFTGTGTGRIILAPFNHSLAANTNYRVEIDLAGTESTATYRWSDDGGATWDQTGQPFTGFGVYNLGSTGVSFAIEATGIFDLADRFDFVAIGTANQVELIRADTTMDTLYLGPTSVSLPRILTSSRTALTINDSGYTIGASDLQFVGIGFAGSLSNIGRTGTIVHGASITPYIEEGVVAEITAIVASPLIYGATVGTSYAIQVVPTFSTLGAGSGTSYGIYIQDCGNPNFDNLTVLDILSQTAAGTATYNIRQRGTVGVNVFAAPTAVGVDAPPATGLTLDVTGDAAVSSQLHVGAVTVPAAGVALQLTGGGFRMAASPNNIIQDSAGALHLTFANDATAESTVVTTQAGRFRVQGQVAIGQATTDSSRLAITNPASIAPASSVWDQMNVIVTSALTKNMTTVSGLRMQGTLSIAGFNTTLLAGMVFAPTIAFSSGTGTHTAVGAASFTPILTAVGSPVITDLFGLRVSAGSSVSANVTATNVSSILINNTSIAGTVTTAAGLKMVARTGGATNNYSLYILGDVAPSLHRPTMLIGGTTDVQAPIVSALLELDSTTGAFLPPRMTTAEKNALTAALGMIVYDTTLNTFEGYQGAGAWAAL